MFPEVLNSDQKKILPGLAEALVDTDLYLAGDTALALQLGHRTSIDYDWFAKQIGKPDFLIGKLGQMDFTVTSISHETIYIEMNNVKVSFIGYGNPMLQPPLIWDEYGIKLAGLDDIAGMKLSAIAWRGARKDFIDLHHLISNFHTLPHYLNI